jgi:hypothetical protein
MLSGSLDDQLAFCASEWVPQRQLLDQSSLGLRSSTSVADRPSTRGVAELPLGS